VRLICKPDRFCQGRDRSAVLLQLSIGVSEQDVGFGRGLFGLLKPCFECANGLAGLILL